MTLTHFRGLWVEIAAAADDDDDYDDDDDDDDDSDSDTWSSRGVGVEIAWQHCLAARQQDSRRTTSLAS